MADEQIDIGLELQAITKGLSKFTNQLEKIGTGINEVLNQPTAKQLTKELDAIDRGFRRIQPDNIKKAHEQMGVLGERTGRATRKAEKLSRKLKQISIEQAQSARKGALGAKRDPSLPSGFRRPSGTAISGRAVQLAQRETATLAKGELGQLASAAKRMDAFDASIKRSRDNAQKLRQKVAGLSKEAQKLGPAFKSLEVGSKVQRRVARETERVAEGARKASQAVKQMKGELDQLALASQRSKSRMQDFSKVGNRATGRLNRFKEILNGGWKELRQFAKGLADGIRSLNPFGESTRQSTNATRKFANSIGKAFAQMFVFIGVIQLITGLQRKFTDGIRESIKTMEEMERLKSVFRDVEGGLEGIDQAADNLADRFGIELSEAVFALRKSLSGVPGELESVANASIIATKAAQLQLLSNTSLEDSVALISRAFTVFQERGVSVEEQLVQVAEVADTVAVAIRKAGVATVEDFANQLPDVIGVAEVLGATLRETVAAVSAVEKVIGIEKGTTDLRRVLEQTIKDFGELNKAARDIGIEERFNPAALAQQDLLTTSKALREVFVRNGAVVEGFASNLDDAREKTRALTDEQMAQAKEMGAGSLDEALQMFDRLTEAQQKAAVAAGIEEIVGLGRRTARPMTVLLSQLDEFESINEKIKNEDNFLDDLEKEVFNQPLKQFQRNIQVLNNNFTRLGKFLAGTFLPVMNAILPVFNELFDGFNKVFGVLALVMQPIQGLINLFRGLTDSMGEGLKTVIKGAVQAFGILAGSLTAATTALVAFNLVAENTTLIRLKDALVGAAKTAGEQSAMIGKFMGVVSKSFKSAGKAARFLFANPIGLAILAVIAIIALLEKRFGFLKKAWEKVRDFFQRNSNKIMESVMMLVRGFDAFIKFMVNNVFLRWAKVSTTVIDLILKGFGFLLGNSADVFGGLWGIVRSFLTNFLDFAQEIGETVFLVVRGFQKFGFKSKEAWQVALLGIVRLVLSWIKNTLSIFRTGLDAIGFVLFKALEKNVDIVLKFFGKLNEFFSGGWSDVWTITKEWAGKLLDIVSNMVNQAIDFFKNLWESAKGVIGLGGKEAKKVSEEAADGIQKAIMDKLSDTKNRVKETLSVLFDPERTFDFASFQESGVAMGSMLFDGLIGVLDGAGDRVSELMEDIVGESPDKVERFFDQLRTALPTEKDVTGFVKTLANKLKGSNLTGLVEKLELASGDVENMLRKLAGFFVATEKAADELGEGGDKMTEAVDRLGDVARTLDSKDISQNVTLAPQIFVQLEQDMTEEEFRRKFLPILNRELQRQAEEQGLLTKRNTSGA